jgi:hypothetical protein
VVCVSIVGLLSSFRNSRQRLGHPKQNSLIIGGNEVNLIVSAKKLFQENLIW